jgi:hypothetical protein
MPFTTRCLTLATLCGFVLTSPASADEQPWTFVQVPDFLNLDVGDLTQYDPAYTGPNSWNASYATALSDITTAIAAENPAYVMVAGDLVMARWINDGHSNGGPGIFGPTRASEAMLDNPSHPDYAATLAAERQRVNNAADFYYPVWQGLFDDAGLTVYGALGDHEIGDDPTFNPGKGGTTLGRETISTYREAFARHVTDPIVGDPNVQVFREAGNQHNGTVYSVRHENVLMIAVDAFRQDSPQALVEDTIRAGDGQLAWIEQQLQAARDDDTIDHVIVQGHSPVIYPVNSRASGGHHFVNGTDGDFWQAMLAGGADLYMAGEVHDVDVKQDEHLMQVSSGSLIGRSDMPDQNWLTGTVYEDRIELEVRYLKLETQGSTGSFYQPGMRGPGQQNLAGSPNEIRETLIVDPNDRGVLSQGGIVLDKSSGRPIYRNGTGVFAGFDTPVNGLQRNRSFEDNNTSGGTTFTEAVAGWYEEPEDLTNAIGSTIDGERFRDSIPDTPHGDNWLNLKGAGAAVYQELGGWSDGQVYGTASRCCWATAASASGTACRCRSGAAMARRATASSSAASAASSSRRPSPPPTGSPRAATPPTARRTHSTSRR